MSTTAHTMLNRFRHISQNSTAPAATSYSPDNGTDPNAPPMSASSTHRNHLKYERTDLPPTELPMLSDQALEDLLSGISNTLLPPLALADGGDAFDGDATNDWFYPGRSVRNGMLPDVDLVEIEIMEISRLS
jgi:hypothetical protein